MPLCIAAIFNDEETAMKKFIAILLSMTIILSLASCGSERSEDAPTESQPPVSEQEPTNSLAETEAENDAETPYENNEPQEESDIQTPAIGADTEESSNILVAYFSRVGNTVWEDSVDAVTSASLNVIDGEFFGNAQLLAQMAQTVTGGELFLIQTVNSYPSDYRETTDVAADEQDDDTRPELASHVENMDQYDTVVLVYPNWWGTLPQPLVTFLEEYDFSGKTVLPLCTHEGSRMGRTEQAIASLCPDATLLDGLAVRGGSAASAQPDVEAWINNSGILE